MNTLNKLEDYLEWGNSLVFSGYCKDWLKSWTMCFESSQNNSDTMSDKSRNSWSPERPEVKSQVSKSLNVCVSFFTSISTNLIYFWNEDNNTSIMGMLSGLEMTDARRLGNWQYLCTLSLEWNLRVNPIARVLSRMEILWILIPSVTGTELIFFSAIIMRSYTSHQALLGLSFPHSVRRKKRNRKEGTLSP